MPRFNWGDRGPQSFLNFTKPLRRHAFQTCGNEAKIIYIWYRWIKLLYFVWSPPWHLYILLLANLLAFCLTYLLAFYLAYLPAYYPLKSSGILSGKHSGTLSVISSGILSDILSGILSGIPSGILSGISSNILSGISPGTLFWHILWHFIWHIFSHSIWHSIWHIFWHSIWLLRSSGAHWARKAPGWGPAVRTELGSQVEVQRCALS